MRKKIFFGLFFFLVFFQRVSNPFQFSFLFAQGVVFTPLHQAYLHYLRGLFLEKEGKISEALTVYKKSLELNPQSRYLQREIARLHLRLGEIEPAVQYLEKLVREDKKDTEALLLLAEVYLVKGKSKEVTNIYEEILTYEPFNREALLNLANLYSKEVITSNEFKKAISLYEQYLNVEPLSYQTADILFKLANLYEKIENKEKALNLYEKIIENFPEHEFLFLAYLNRAKVYEGRGEKEKSLTEYERASALEPENITLLLKLGTLFSELKRNKEAKKIFLKVIEKEPKNIEANYYLLLLANEEKNWDEAIKYAKIIAQLRKDDPKIYFQIGYFYVLKKETKKAIKALKKTIELEPNNSDNFYLLGLAYQDLKKYKLAEKIYQRALGLKAENPEVLLQMALLCDVRKEQEKVIEYFRKVLSFEPKNALALNYIGYTYAEQGINLEEAENLIRQALEVDPKNAAYIDSLGWVYYQKKDYPNALLQLEQASQILEDPIIFDHLGDTYKVLGKMGEAKNVWEKALKLDPKNKKLRNKLKEIDQYLFAHKEIYKLLKRQEGNQKQVFNLVALGKVEIERGKVFFSLPVMLYYRVPKSLRIDFLGNFFLPQASLIIEENEYKLTPQLPFGQGIITENEIVTTLKIFQEWLNGEFYAGMSDPWTKVKKQRSHYLLSTPQGKAKIEKRSARLHSYFLEENTIPQLGLEFRSYFLLDGLWFPKKIRINLPIKKLSISLLLEHVEINQKLDEKIFSLP